MLITPNSDIYVKSGLAKSAFKPDIYEELPLDIYIPSIEMIYHILRSQQKKAIIVPKFYQSHDAYLMFYKPLETVKRALKKQNKASPLWSFLIRVTTASDTYIKLNKITARSDALAIAAASEFLTRVLGKLDVNMLDDMTKKMDGVIPSGVQDEIKNAVNDALGEVLESAEEYVSLSNEAESVMAALGVSQGGQGFATEALSAITFLREPVEVRKRVRLLKNTLMEFRRFYAISYKLSREVIASQYGTPVGIKPLESLSQIADTIPSEIAITQLGDAGRLLFSLKLLQRQVMVKERAATLQPVVFVDKSGSMAEYFSWDEKIEKVSVAAGIALALYRTTNARVYLFDTEVEEVDRKQIVYTLLHIAADGGTNITEVLKEILRIDNGVYNYIIISDGITEAYEPVLQQVVAKGIPKRTSVILVPPEKSDYNWLKEIKQRGGKVFYANTVAQVEKAVMRSLGM